MKRGRPPKQRHTKHGLKLLRSSRYHSAHNRRRARTLDVRAARPLGRRRTATGTEEIHKPKMLLEMTNFCVSSLSLMTQLFTSTSFTLTIHLCVKKVLTLYSCSGGAKHRVQEAISGAGWAMRMVVEHFLRSRWMAADEPPDWSGLVSSQAL